MDSSQPHIVRICSQQDGDHQIHSGDCQIPDGVVRHTVGREVDGGLLIGEGIGQTALVILIQHPIPSQQFKNSDFTAAYFRGQCGNGTGSRILEGNTALTDIWFNTLILFEQDGERYQSDTFAGIPENVTVHLPASMTEEQRSQCEDFLHSIGVPDTAAFNYYSLQ